MLSDEYSSLVVGSCFLCVYALEMEMRCINAGAQCYHHRFHVEEGQQHIFGWFLSYCVKFNICVASQLTCLIGIKLIEGLMGLSYIM